MGHWQTAASRHLGSYALWSKGASLRSLHSTNRHIFFCLHSTIPHRPLTLGIPAQRPPLVLAASGWTKLTHHHARRQGWPLPVVVAMGELQVEEQSTVRCRVQAVRVHQHLQAEAAVPVKPGGVHHT